METKINVRGGIDALEVNQSLTLPKSAYKPSVIRSTAASIKEDTGKAFTVFAGEESIVVTRLS